MYGLERDIGKIPVEKNPFTTLHILTMLRLGVRMHFIGAIFQPMIIIMWLCAACFEEAAALFKENTTRKCFGYIYQV